MSLAMKRADPSRPLTERRRQTPEINVRAALLSAWSIQVDGRAGALPLPNPSKCEEEIDENQGDPAEDDEQ